MSDSCYQIARTRISIPDSLPIQKSYQGFLASPKQSKPWENWQVTHCGEVEAGRELLNSSRLQFDSGESWSCHITDDECVLYALFNRIDEERVLKNIYVLGPGEKMDVWGSGFGFPLDELFFLHSFAQTQCVSIHSATYAIEDRAFLFCGVSGAGKTTMADALRSSELSGRTLCDDRNVVYEDDGVMTVCGTPWHGSGRYYSPECVGLSSLVILDDRHSDFSFEQVKPADALPYFLRTLFYSISFKEDMLNTMTSLDSLLDRLPCFHLKYDRHKIDIVEFLSKELFVK